jgi:2-oxoglutarate dehydrogenase E2 component (dihydrolipoamide succinyltransferase)
MASIQMTVPPVGESITEVTIAAWNKKEGDSVNADEVLCELESDKATFELRAETAGTLHILAQEGETLAINAPICTIETGNGQAPAPASAPATPKPAEGAAAVANAAMNDARPTETSSEKPESPVASRQSSEAPASGTSGQAIEVKIPAVGESITEVTIATWNKKDGDAVKMDEVLCELESDKATFELPAEAAGTLRIVAQAGTTVPIGGVVATITAGAGTPAPSSQPTNGQPQSTNNEVRSTIETAHATPVAAAILAEKGIDPKTIQGSGPGGKITKEDAVKAGTPSAVGSGSPQAAPQVQTPTLAPKPAPAASPQAQSTTPEARAERRQRLSSLRKTIARRLVAVKNETAMLTTFNEVDMKPIMDMRSKFKDKFKEKHGVGLGFMSFFAKAVCVALKEFPAVNAALDGDEIVYHDYCDISIAVSTERGLVVPVVRNADQMSFAGIEKEIINLATLARDNKLTIEQMTGGTFTITNGGVFGSMLSTPIINAPQVAILGMHNIVERPVVIDGQITVRPIMYVALSYDHRIIDGKESVSFLVRVKQLLEDPARLLLDV